MSNRKFGRNPRLAGALLALFVLAGMGNLSHAYTVNPNATSPYKWDSSKAPYSHDPSFAWENPGWNETSGRAMDAWNNLADNPFYFYYLGLSGNNTIFAQCKSEFDSTYDDGDGITLAAAYTWVSNGKFTDYKIVVNTCNITRNGKLEGPTPFYDGTQAPSLPPNYTDLKSVMIHEYGHALGLCHTATEGRAMDGTLRAGEIQPIMSNDAIGARYIYNRSSVGTLPEAENCRHGIP